MIYNKKLIIKLAIGFAGFSVATTSSILPILLAKQEINPSTNHPVSRTALKNQILDDSILTGTKTYIEYDGHLFLSENELNEYILSNAQIESFITSSDPMEIINLGTGVLDKNKIYDANIDNFVQVYENAYGQVTDNKQEALDSYIGSVRPYYSYDMVNWYDSPEEAKLAQKAEMKVSKSLYYYYNGRYYNAFNTKDINELLKTMSSAYYGIFQKDLLGKDKEVQEVIKGEGSNFFNSVKEYLEKDFKSDEYLKTITDIESSIFLSLAPREDFEITVQYYDQSGKFISNNYFHNEEAKIQFAPVKNLTTESEIKEWFTDETKWSVEFEWNGGHAWGKRYYTRQFEIIADGQKVKATINLFNTATRIYDNQKLPDIENDFMYRWEPEGRVNLYTNQSKDEYLATTPTRLDLLTTANLTTEEKNDFYTKWYQRYFYEVLTDFGSNQNKQVTWESIKNSEYITSIDSEYHIGEVYKDLAYDINYTTGYSQSLIQSQINWRAKKQEILKNPISTENGTRYAIRPDLLVSREALDNYLHLEGTIDARMMYVVSPEEHSSDPTGAILSNTQTEALEKEMLFKETSLRKQYRIRDAYGNVMVSNNTEEAAIKEMQSQINLNSKYIHKDELKAIGDKNKSWDSIISNGNYEIFGIKNPNNEKEKIWFATQESALDAIKTNSNFRKELERSEENVYVYNYMTQDKILIPITYAKDEIDEVVELVINYESMQ